MNETYFQQYLLIGILGGAGIFMGAFPLILARFISPKKPGQAKQSAYECGLESTGDPWVQFRVQYYVYALLFVVFDVAVVFIYPWAVTWRALGPYALGVMGVFLGILGVALAYAWRRGVLEWK